MPPLPAQLYAVTMLLDDEVRRTLVCRGDSHRFTQMTQMRIIMKAQV
jgi:hypothetical protein